MARNRRRGTKKRSSRRSLGMESLHKREMMAANVFLGGDTLYILADSQGGTVEVEQTPSQQVTVRGGGIGTPPSWARGSVDQIYFIGSSANDTFINDTDIPSIAYGGDGNDDLRGGSDADTFYGGNGVDFLRGFDGQDVLYGQGDTDWFRGGNGSDVIVGGHGNDYLYGDSGSDVLSGGEGNDRLEGGSGADELHGGNGADYLDGGTQDDVVRGGNHDDTLIGGYGNDELYGDAGNDKLYGGSDNDLLDGGAGNDLLDGYSGADRLLGGGHNDRLYGGAGNDYLDGGSGNDHLYGGAGHDGLYGGSGVDYLRGESGNDRFLRHIGASGLTVIVDAAANDATINFENGQRRRFNFSGGDWSEFADGQFTPAEIEQVDQFLADLHDQTGNTKLLKKADGGELHLQRLGRQIAGNFDADGVNGGGKITLVDDSFSSEDWLAQVVFHEIGHNWDNENARWDQWKSISGWRDGFGFFESQNGYTKSGDGDWWYRNGSTFARNYGTRNPYEDFATYFAKVMMDDTGRNYGGDAQSATNATKEWFMDQFFASLA